MTGKDLVRMLQENGWSLDHISGSHHIMTKAGMRSVPVPVHGSRDIPKGLAHKILKQAGIKKGG